MQDGDEITRFGIRRGGSARWRLTFSEDTADSMWFVIKPPSSQAVKQDLAAAGIAMDFSGDKATATLTPSKQFNARADAQIVDFELPDVLPNGQPTVRKFSKNMSRNHEVYDDLTPETKTILMSAMLCISGDEELQDEDARAAWEALKNAHPSLLTELVSVA